MLVSLGRVPAALILGAPALANSLAGGLQFHRCIALVLVKNSEILLLALEKVWLEGVSCYRDCD